jgi:hypothetical protein
VRRSRYLLFNPKTVKLELLQTPLSRLPITIADGPAGAALRQIQDDLTRTRLRKFEPFFYLSTGYGTVEGTTNIGIGFYDTHPLIRELHREFRKWQYNPEEILATLRHEIGHAFCYAYKLYRRKDFRETFNVRGHFFRTYPVTNRYVERANPWSRDYVNPMGDHYAQKHPDEDFAETFSVWMTPHVNWRRVYRRYPGALRKLAYVDAVVRELRRLEPEFENDPSLLDEPIVEMPVTLGVFLKATVGKYRRDATGYVDSDLRKLFRRLPSRSTALRNYQPAVEFIQEQRPFLINRVGSWVKADPLVVKDLLDKCQARSRDLRLVLHRKDRERTLVEMACYISLRCTQFASTGRYFG